MKKNAPAIVALFLVPIFLSSLGNPCLAQSINGSWRLTAAKGKATDKASGRTEDISQQMQSDYEDMEYLLVFKPDHSMASTIGTTSGNKLFSNKGTYTLEGDKLTITVEGAKKARSLSGDTFSSLPAYSIVKFSGKNIILHISIDIIDDGHNIHVDEDWILSPAPAKTENK